MTSMLLLLLFVHLASAQECSSSCNEQLGALLNSTLKELTEMYQGCSQENAGEELDVLLDHTLGEVIDTNLNCGPAKDCTTMFKRGHVKSQVYSIQPAGSPEPFNAFCDMTDGGWTILVRRFNGSVWFNVNWNPYKNGFGSVEGEYWLGLDNIHYLTSQGSYRLRVEFKYYNDDILYYAEYSTFRVDGEDTNYILHISGFSGNTTYDALTNGANSHDGMAFSTKDRDNDANKNGHCAGSWKGGFWYKQCHFYGVPTQLYKRRGGGKAIEWGPWKPVREITWKVKPN